jgi:hypothetical protein
LFFLSRLMAVFSRCEDFGESSIFIHTFPHPRKKLIFCEALARWRKNETRSITGSCHCTPLLFPSSNLRSTTQFPFLNGRGSGLLHHCPSSTTVRFSRPLTSPFPTALSFSLFFPRWLRAIIYETVPAQYPSIILPSIGLALLITSLIVSFYLTDDFEEVLPPRGCVLNALSAYVYQSHRLFYSFICKRSWADPSRGASSSPGT